jgi:23S rRNA (pseudouridine1915-N3)-methyltransferase
MPRTAESPKPKKHNKGFDEQQIAFHQAKYMILKIIAVGRLRERYWQDAVADYARRLRPYVRLEMLELAESRIPEKASINEENKAIAKEALTILEKLKGHNGPVIVLDKKGKAFDSLMLAAWVENQLLVGRNEIAWVIGGPLGLAPAVLDRADLVLSFSEMTFPHQMMRLILIEQIYRSFRIMHHEPYHK